MIGKSRRRSIMGTFAKSVVAVVLALLVVGVLDQFVGFSKWLAPKAQNAG